MIKRAYTYMAALAVVLTLTACGGNNEPPEGVKMPGSASDFESQPYEDVVAALEDAGFVNVEAVPLGDLITGWLSEEFSVDEVDADGNTDFAADDYFDADAKIVVSYHSFPEDEDEEPSAEPSAPAEPQTLTIENNADLAALLTTQDNCSSVMADFSSKYAGQTIEFDANIGAMANHGDYATRYDILILPGDYSETTMIGPTFQYRDVNTVNELNYVGEVPDSIGVGDNLRVTAIVGEFDSNTCQFQLDPVATAFR